MDLRDIKGGIEMALSKSAYTAMLRGLMETGIVDNSVIEALQADLDEKDAAIIGLSPYAEDVENYDIAFPEIVDNSGELEELRTKLAAAQESELNMRKEYAARFYGDTATPVANKVEENDVADATYDSIFEEIV